MPTNLLHNFFYWLPPNLSSPFYAFEMIITEQKCSEGRDLAPCDCCNFRDLNKSRAKFFRGISESKGHFNWNAVLFHAILFDKARKSIGLRCNFGNFMHLHVPYERNDNATKKTIFTKIWWGFQKDFAGASNVFLVHGLDIITFVSTVQSECRYRYWL